MKDNLTVKKTVRFRKDEYEFLQQKMSHADASGKRYHSFSDFVREYLLSNSGYHSSMVKHQLADIRYEINKIGVNVNQMAKKVNGGFGTPADMKTLQVNLIKIQVLFEEYEKKVDELWQSQS